MKPSNYVIMANRGGYSLSQEGVRLNRDIKGIRGVNKGSHGVPKYIGAPGFKFSAQRKVTKYFFVIKGFTLDEYNVIAFPQNFFRGSAAPRPLTPVISNSNCTRNPAGRVNLMCSL